MQPNYGCKTLKKTTVNDKVRKFRLSEETRVQNGVTLRRIEYLRTLVGAGGSLDGDFQLSGEGVIIAMPS